MVNRGGVGGAGGLVKGGIVTRGGGWNFGFQLPTMWPMLNFPHSSNAVRMSKSTISLFFSSFWSISKHLSSIDDVSSKGQPYYSYFTWDRKRGIIISHSSFFLPLLCQAAVHPAPYLNRQLMWNTPYKQNLIKTLLLSLKLFPDQVLSWLNGNLWLHLVDHIPYVTFAVFLDFLIGQISQYHDLKVTKMPKLFIKMDHEFRDALNITFEFNLLILFFIN